MDSELVEKVARIRKWLGKGSIDIFGLPFAGKDTHGQELAEIFGGVLLGGGDILRGEDMSPRIKALMSTGELLPIKDYLEIILPRLHNVAYKSKPLILSSVGRWHGEEAGVIEASTRAGHPLRAVLFLDVTESEIWKRWQAEEAALLRGPRDDDSAEKLVIRLEEFRNKTLPVVDFYRQENLLIRIDGTPPKKKVLANIVDELYQRAVTA